MLGGKNPPRSAQGRSYLLRSEYNPHGKVEGKKRTSFFYDNLYNRFMISQGRE